MLQQESSQEGLTPAAWKTFKRQLEASSHEQEQRDLLGNLNLPNNLTPKLGQPFPAFVERFIVATDSRFHAPAHDTDQTNSGRLQSFISEGAINNLKSLLFAVEFAALARGLGGGPTLLEEARVLFGNKPRRRGRLP
ncbi:hypothetical protein L107_07368 [Cyanobium sp. Copco_Reservoir_LC18]|uniref:hypothetical protein n=1 Tax=Cyanobium sp. Copco_Reservoir_LC18 TaxID=1328305 RepID=UPI00135B0935|nr:hypothetical protein [Cyanobium sp. Copco_Reservoir_LC18]KAF0653393.1 hypothetical protein L107_07368 [Cyanobium sp. Copco_Reservoir_LC18]